MVEERRVAIFRGGECAAVLLLLRATTNRADTMIGAFLSVSRDADDRRAHCVDAGRPFSCLEDDEDVEELALLFAMTTGGKKFRGTIAGRSSVVFSSIRFLRRRRD